MQWSYNDLFICTTTITVKRTKAKDTDTESNASIFPNSAFTAFTIFSRIALSLNHLSPLIFDTFNRPHPTGRAPSRILTSPD